MFKKFLRALNQHLEEYLIALFLIAITFVMLLQIVMRYVFQHSLSWPEEFSRYCFVYITFLTFGYCIQHDSMLRLDIIKEVLPKKAWDVLQVIVILISAAFFLIMLLYSFDLLQSMRETGRVSAALGIFIFLLRSVSYWPFSVQHSVSGVLSQGILKKGRYYPYDSGYVFGIYFVPNPLLSGSHCYGSLFLCSRLNRLKFLS